MKKIRYIICLLGLLSFYSCNDWLQVSPKTEITQEDLFKTQSGFADALTGVYIKLKGSESYGLNLTMKTTELLISSYDVSTNTAEYNFAYNNYAYAGCESTIQSIYASLYNIIIEVNAILEYVDKAKNNKVFTTDGFYEIVKGEALAIRALCHFEILRLWGPVPTLANSDNILPYVTRLGTSPNSHINFNDYSKILLADLLEAEKLLNSKDPITDLSVPATPNSEPFFSTRAIRLNYYGVKALQARVNLYLGNKQAAGEAAKIVVNVAKEDGTKLFKLGVLSDFTATTNVDYTLKSEHIFALTNHNRYQTYESNFLSGSLKKGSSHTSAANTLFGGEVASDIRANLWVTAQNSGGTNIGINKKYYALKNTTSGLVDTRIPIIRISEMYLILAEVLPLAEAQTYWQTYRLSRNIPVTTLSDENKIQEIGKEYRKEFYGEGQSFFFHKRVNSTKSQITWFPTAATAILNYVWPLPKTELIN